MKSVKIIYLKKSIQNRINVIIISNEDCTCFSNITFVIVFKESNKNISILNTKDILIGLSKKVFYFLGVKWFFFFAQNDIFNQ